MYFIWRSEMHNHCCFSSRQDGRERRRQAPAAVWQHMCGCTHTTTSQLSAAAAHSAQHCAKPQRQGGFSSALRVSSCMFKGLGVYNSPLSVRLTFKGIHFILGQIVRVSQTDIRTSPRLNIQWEYPQWDKSGLELGLIPPREISPQGVLGCTCWLVPWFVTK